MRTQSFCFKFLFITAVLAANQSHAKEENVSVRRLLIQLKSTADAREECKSLGENVMSVIENEGRFLPRKKGASDFLLRIVCSEGKAGLVFFYSPEADSQLQVASYWTSVPELETLAEESFASELWSKLRDQLPWNGEVIGLKSTITPADYDENSGGLYPRAKGFVTIGLNYNSLLGTCIPLEVGVLSESSQKKKAEFTPLFLGILRTIDLKRSKMEIYTEEDKIPLDKFYVTRLGDPGALPDGAQEVLKYCHNHPNFDEPKKLTDIFSNVFGKDAVEVNSVLQRFGASVLSLRGGNGSISQPMLGAYIHNRLLFGQFYMVDAFGMRFLYSGKYKPDKGGAYMTKPESTIGELFVGGRARYQRLNLFLGTGLILEKSNIPYDLPQDAGGGTNNRMSSARFGVMLGGSYGFNRLKCAFRLPVAQSQGRRYIDFHNYCTYRLSSTWLAGGDLLYVNAQAKERYAPPVQIFAAGGFLGIELGR